MKSAQLVNTALMPPALECRSHECVHTVKRNSNTSQPLPKDEDEFLRAGVTPQPCIDAPAPRVAESPAHFECRYLSTHRLRGNSNHGWVEVVYAEVMRIHVHDEVITPEGKLDIPKIRPLARLGYYDYTSITEVFEMCVPGAHGLLNAGLEGKSS